MTAWKIIENCDYGEDSAYRLYVETVEGKDGLDSPREIVINYGETKEYAETDARDWEIARLIAAAPAMLAALEADPTKCDHKFPHLSACYCCQRDAAIALAKGEAPQ